MTNVNPVNGIVYGFRLMGYLLAVLIIGGLLALVGQDIEGIVGGLIALVGGLVIFAGFAGIQYKIIADGVERGIRASQGAAPADNGPSGLPFINTSSQGSQQGRRASRQQEQRQPRAQRNQGGQRQTRTQRNQGQRQTRTQRNQGQGQQGQSRGHEQNSRGDTGGDESSERPR